MASPHNKPKKGNGSFFLSMALGAALAAATGYYVQHKEEVDKEAKKQLEILAKRFKQTRKQVEARVKDVWGDVSDEGIHRYMDLRGAILEALQEEAIQRTGTVIKKNYDATVKRILDSALKAGLLTKDNELKLKEVFAMDWEDIQKMLASGAKMVSNLAKKAPSAIKKASLKKKTANTVRKSATSVAMNKKKNLMKGSFSKQKSPKTIAHSKSPKKNNSSAAKTTKALNAKAKKSARFSVTKKKNSSKKK